LQFCWVHWVLWIALRIFVNILRLTEIKILCRLFAQFANK
jgi:hypothetical protein